MLFPDKKIKRGHEMKLRGYMQLEAILRLKSGLHIGRGEKPDRGESLSIMESRRTGLPYIPGSSLKGKMRFILESVYGRLQTDPKDPGSPCWCGKCQICLLFGSGSSNNTFEPTRLIFRDCFLTNESAELLEKINLEEKPGVRIDRTSGKAAGGALFPAKRVPEGSEFEFNLSVRVFENDVADSIRRWLATGLFFMEQDAIGGGGTRGSGRIEFDSIKFNGLEFDKNWRTACKEGRDTLQDLHVKTPQ
jgi:CRISPR-associated protein Csm3